MSNNVDWYKCDKDVDWYDYGKQEPNGLPRLGESLEVEWGGEWCAASVVGESTEDVPVIEFSHNKAQMFQSADNLKIRPLDWNRNQKKPVDLSWLVDSGIDCEFSDDKDWRVGSLKVIKEDDFPYKRLNGDGWERCRPRMNHPMLLTKKQFSSIPADGFNWLGYSTVRIDEDIYQTIIFTGLVDGYCWPWEVGCE